MAGIKFHELWFIIIIIIITDDFLLLHNRDFCLA